MRTPDPEVVSQARRYSNYIQMVRWRYHSDELDSDELDMMLHDMYYMLKPEIKYALDYLCQEGEIE